MKVVKEKLHSIIISSVHICKGETCGYPQNPFSSRYLDVRSQRTSFENGIQVFPAIKFSLTLERYFHDRVGTKGFLRSGVSDSFSLRARHL